MGKSTMSGCRRWRGKTIFFQRSIMNTGETRFGRGVDFRLVVVVRDHLNLDDKTGVSTHDTDVYGMYVAYKATEKLALNFRGEYVHWGDLPGVSSSGGTDPFSPGDEVLGFT